MRTYFGEGVTDSSRSEKAGREGRGTEVLAEHWETLPKKSIDYAVAEPSGRWRSISRSYRAAARGLARSGQAAQLDPVLSVDDTGNRTQGLVTHLDSKNCVCVNEDQHHRITTIGCEDLVVVHTPRATLVCPRDEAQRVKELRNLLPEEER